MQLAAHAPTAPPPPPAAGPHPQRRQGGCFPRLQRLHLLSIHLLQGGQRVLGGGEVGAQVARGGLGRRAPLPLDVGALLRLRQRSPRRGQLRGGGGGGGQNWGEELCAVGGSEVGPD
jgi:hypothetical protein